MRVVCLLLALLLAACSAPHSVSDVPRASDASSSRWLEAIDAGDTEAAVEAVQDVLERVGVDFQTSFGWDLKPYNEPLNFYDTATKRVTLGRAPTADETSAYWQIYSDRLTGSAWSADAFFRDADEARRMASFNQAYLAAHEAGHALAYHYAVNPAWDVVSEDPYVVSVHCQELLADRVAAAFLSEVTESVPRADAYRERYLELMVSIDAQIPSAQRLRLSSLDVCSEVPVLHPQDEATFQSYVSAFFERQRLLLSGRQLELAEVLDEHILWRRATFVASAPDLPGTVVTTLPEPREIAEPTSDEDFPSGLGFSLAMMFDSLSATSGMAEGTAYAILDDGQVLVVTSTSMVGIDTLSASPYTYADFRAETTLRINGEMVRLHDLGDATAAAVQSAVARSEDDVLVLMAIADISLASSEAWELSSLLQLFRLRRADGEWRAEAGVPFPRADGARTEDVMIGAGGAVFVESAGQLYRVELASLELVEEGQAIDPTWGDLQTLDTEGRRISVRHDVVGDMRTSGGQMVRGDAGGVIIRSEQAGAVTLAGSGLALHRDGPGPRAHLGWIAAMRVTDEGLLFVEQGDEMRVRRIRLPQP